MLDRLINNILLKHTLRERENGKNQIRMPAIIPILGGFGIALGILMTVFSRTNGEPLWLTILGVVIALFFLWGFLLGIFFRIRWDKKGFSVRSFYGILRRYSYSDLRAFTETNESYTLFLREGTIRLSGIEFNAAAFLKVCKKEYALLHHDQPLPYRPHTKPKKTRK